MSGPDEAEKHRLRGNEHFKKGNYEGALEEFYLGLEQDPENIRLLNNMAITQRALKKFKDALKTYDRILTIDPDNDKALVGKQKCLDSMPEEDEEAAITFVEEEEVPDVEEPEEEPEAEAPEVMEPEEEVPEEEQEEEDWGEDLLEDEEGDEFDDVFSDLLDEAEEAVGSKNIMTPPLPTTVGPTSVQSPAIRSVAHSST